MGVPLDIPVITCPVGQVVIVDRGTQVGVPLDIPIITCPAGQVVLVDKGTQLGVPLDIPIITCPAGQFTGVVTPGVGSMHTTVPVGPFHESTSPFGQLCLGSGRLLGGNNCPACAGSASAQKQIAAQKTR
jgi:hypothetical protein